MSRFRFIISLLVILGLLSSGTGVAAQEGDTGKKENPGYAVEGKTPEKPGEILFLGEPKSGDPLEIAMKYLQQNKNLLGLTGADLLDIVVTDQYTDEHNGVTHIYLKQRYKGIEVANGNLNINIAQDGSVINLGHSFVSNLAAAVNRQSPGKNASDSVTSAANHLGLSLQKELKVLSKKGGPTQEVLLSDGGVSQEPIPTKLVYQPISQNQVRLAWQIDILEPSGEYWWSMIVDAENGNVLAQLDYMDHDNWGVTTEGGYGNQQGATSSQSPSLFPSTDGASYNVFHLPFESPSDGDRTLVINAVNPSASPFGWHDTDGIPGPEFTVTRGNNVHAYADRDNNNLPDPGSDPDGGPTLNFNFPLDLTKRPLDSQPAIVTNLFYWNNIVHDVTYGYGFNETAGNFQVNNYGKGGAGNDDVRAEAQDGSGRNNANFSTLPDGFRPRMQMFEWRSALPNTITVAAPSPIAGTYFGPMAGFGESLVTTGPLLGEVLLINDGVGNVTDGCEPFAVPAGSIPLIDRGTCTFVTKVKNAQNAGAAVAIVANNIAGSPIAMGGTDPTITIPSVMISLADGNLFKANLPVNVTIADGTGGAPDRDSDLDAGVIAHEYGHGISNRLTGGPATASCLGNAEQMGEGWSDWFALTLTTSPSDTSVTPRGIGSYVSFQPADGVGIRPTPYTTDMSVNPSTYSWVADTINISQPHGIGYVWNSMLWEVYWNLVNKHGYNPDVYGNWTTGGNNLAIQLVMDGMKLQPCRPGFVDGRDAILQADQILTDGANQCAIWEGFAKRGLGVSASQGSSLSRSDGVEAFDVPMGCNFGGFIGSIKNLPTVNTAKAGSAAPLVFSLSGDQGLDIFAAGYPASQEIDCNTKAPIGDLELVSTPPNSGLTYDPLMDRYTLPWKTNKSWAITCRQLVVRFRDNTDPRIAYFDFTK